MQCGTNSPTWLLHIQIHPKKSCSDLHSNFQYWPMLLIKTLLSASSHQVHGVMCLYLATNAWTLITNTCSSIYLLRLMTSTYICNKVILYQCKMLLLWELLPLYNWLSSLLIFISLEHNTNLASTGTLKACMLTRMVSLLTYMVT